MSNAIPLLHEIGVMGKTRMYAGGPVEDMFFDGKWAARFEGSLGVAINTNCDAHVVAGSLGIPPAAVVLADGRALVDVYVPGSSLDDARMALIAQHYGGAQAPALYLGGIGGFGRFRVTGHNMYDILGNQTVYSVMSDNDVLPVLTIVTDTGPPKPVSLAPFNNVSLGFGATVFAMSNYFEAARGTAPLTFAVTANPMYNAVLIGGSSNLVMAVNARYRDASYEVGVTATNALGKRLTQTLSVTETAAPSPMQLLSLGSIVLGTTPIAFAMSNHFRTAVETSPLEYAFNANPMSNGTLSTGGNLVLSGNYRGTQYDVRIEGTNVFGKALVQAMHVTEPESPSPVQLAPLGSLTLSSPDTFSYEMSDYFSTAEDTRPLTYAIESDPQSNAVLTSGVLRLDGGTFRGVSYAVRVNATNAYGKSLVQDLLVTDPPPPPPTIAAPMGSVTLTTQTMTYSMSNHFSTPDGTWPLTYGITANPQSNATLWSDVLHVSGAYRETAYGVRVTSTNVFEQTLTQELSVTELTAPLPTSIGTLGPASLSNDVGTYGLYDYFTTTEDTEPLRFYVVSNPMNDATLTDDGVLTVVSSYRATTYDIILGASNAFGKTATRALTVTEALTLSPLYIPPPPLYTGVADVVVGLPSPSPNAMLSSPLTWTLAPPALAAFVDAATGVIRVPRGTPSIATTEATLTARGAPGIVASIPFSLATELWAAPMLAPVANPDVAGDTKTAELVVMAPLQLLPVAGPMTWQVEPARFFERFLDPGTGTLTLPLHTYVPPYAGVRLIAVGETGKSASVDFTLSVVPWETPVAEPPSGVPGICYTGRGVVRLPPPAQTEANTGTVTWSVSPADIPGVSVDASSGVLTLAQNTAISPPAELTLTATGPAPASYAANTAPFSVAAVPWAAPMLEPIADQTGDTISVAFKTTTPVVTPSPAGGDMGTLNWTVKTSAAVVLDTATGILTVAANVSVPTGTMVYLTASGPAPTYLRSTRTFALSVDGTVMQEFLVAPPTLTGNNTAVPLVLDAATILLKTTVNLAPLTWTLINQPAGVTVDDATGMITVTSGTAITKATFTVQVSSRRGTVSGFTTMNLTTYDAPVLSTSPVTLSGDNTTATLPYDASSYLVTATNLGPLTWTLTNAPAGVTVNATTGLITAAAGYAVTNATFTVTVSGQRGAASKSMVMSLTTYDAPTFSAAAIAQPLGGNNSILLVTIDATVLLTTKTNLGPGLAWYIAPAPGDAAMPSVTIDSSTGLITAQPEIAVSGRAFVLTAVGRRGSNNANIVISLTTIPPSTTVINLGVGGVAGQAGPTLAQLTATMALWAANTRYFSLYASTSGYQLMNMPALAICTITLAGAQGGGETPGSGGKGATFTVKVTLQEGDALLVVVGQAGAANGGYGTSAYAGGGGGGTFVALVPSGSTVWTKLLAAAGGGGGFSGGGYGTGGNAATSYVTETTTSIAGATATYIASGNGAGWAQDAALAKCVTNGFFGGGAGGGFGGGGDANAYGGGGGGGYIGGSAAGRYSAGIGINGGGNFVHSSVTLVGQITVGTHINGLVSLSYRTATVNEAAATLGSVTLTNKTPYTVTLNNYFMSHAPIMYYLATNPYNSASINNTTGMLTMTGNLRNNSYSVAVSASNTTGQAVGKSTLEVTESPPARPTATSMGTFTLKDTPLSYNVASYFVDPQASTLSYYMSANPQNNATLTGTTLAARGDGRGVTYDVRVSASNTYNMGSSSALTVTEPSGPLYTFTAYNFNTVNSVANTGPALSVYQAAYAAQQFYIKGYFSLYASYNGYQMISVPKSGIYNIEAIGGSGGNATQRTGTGGPGGYMPGKFKLAYGQRLVILVGQRGGDGLADQAGGGGGTFVVLYDGNVLTPLVVACGGGGAAKYAYGSGGSGLVTNVADNGNGSGVGAGAGYVNFAGNGLSGGNAFGILGGFGGGGVTVSKGGGGGGFKGGNGGTGNTAGAPGGYGGYSYVASGLSTYVADSSAGQNNNASYGNGYAIITFVA